MAYLGCWLMHRFAPDTSGSGIPQIEGLLKGYLPLIWQRVLPIKFLAGTLLVESGMVLGREGLNWLEAIQNCSKYSYE